MTALRTQINSNFYQLVDADDNGDILNIKPQFLTSSGGGNTNYSDRAGSAANVDGWIKVPFNFDDTSPKLVAVIPADAVVASVDIIIINSFSNDATLTVGTVATVDELVTTSDVNPSDIGVYTTCPGKIYLSETHVLLTITPGSSSSGKGMLIIKF